MPKINEFNYQRAHDEKLLSSICVAAVVQVTAFDPDKMTVNVQPLSKHLENGKYESQPPILRVPVAGTRCGGFIFRPWIKAGDTGVVVYLDHDMDGAVTGGKESVPLTERNHSMSDAVFIGGIVSGIYTVPGLPEKSLALAREDGCLYIAVAEDRIIVKNKETTAEFKADRIDMKTATVTIKADVVVDGKIKAFGGIS